MLAGIVLSTALLAAQIQERTVHALIAQGRYVEALPILEAARARPGANLASVLNELPPDHPDLASYRNSYAFLLRKLDRKKEARRLEEAARLSRERFERDNALGLTVDARRSFRLNDCAGGSRQDRPPHPRALKGLVDQSSSRMDSIAIDRISATSVTMP